MFSAAAASCADPIRSPHSSHVTVFDERALPLAKIRFVICHIHYVVKSAP